MPTKQHPTRLQRVNWLIMTSFLLILLAFCAAIYLQENKKIDRREMGNNVEEIETTLNEAIIIARYHDHQTSAYYESQLEDLEKNMQDMKQSLEQKQYDPSISKSRQKTLSLLSDTTDSLHNLSLRYDDPAQRNSAQKDLENLTEKIKNLKNTL